MSKLMTLETNGRSTEWRLLCKPKRTLRVAAKLARAIESAAPDSEIGLRAMAVAQAIAELLNASNAPPSVASPGGRDKALPTGDRT